jgi:hypothetical protein
MIRALVDAGFALKLSSHDKHYYPYVSQVGVCASFSAIHKPDATLMGILGDVAPLLHEHLPRIILNVMIHPIGIVARLMVKNVCRFIGCTSCNWILRCLASLVL